MRPFGLETMAAIWPEPVTGCRSCLAWSSCCSRWRRALVASAITLPLKLTTARRTILPVGVSRATPSIWSLVPVWSMGASAWRLRPGVKTKVPSESMRPIARPLGVRR
jgi:hypothetical protein